MAEHRYKFDAGARVLHVNWAYFLYIQDQCRIDPQYPDRLAAEFGVGPVEVLVDLADSGEANGP